MPRWAGHLTAFVVSMAVLCVILLAFLGYLFVLILSVVRR